MEVEGCIPHAPRGWGIKLLINPTSYKTTPKIGHLNDPCSNLCSEQGKSWTCCMALQHELGLDQA